jgi:hypothetical protein
MMMTDDEIKNLTQLTTGGLSPERKRDGLVDPVSGEGRRCYSHKDGIA